MSSRIGIGEAAELAFLIIHQPAETLLWWEPFNLDAVLVRHLDTMTALIRWIWWALWADAMLVRERLKPALNPISQQSSTP